MNDNWSRPIMRPLPRPVVPAQDETLRSYLGRLARANRLDTDALRTHLTGTKAKYTAVEVDALARISGRSNPLSPIRRPRALHRTRRRRDAHHRSATTARPVTTELHPLHPRPRTPRPGVELDHPENLICQRHRRWIGTEHDQTAHYQPSLDDQPEILQAGEQHRRLIHQHGRAVITTEFGHAAQICHHWHRRLEHDDDFYRLMERFHNGQWRITPTDPTVHAARYPQIIALTRLLASPRWPSQTRWPPPQQFIHELHRTVAPDFQWAPTGHNGTRDPLITHLHNQRCCPDEIPKSPSQQHEANQPNPST